MTAEGSAYPLSSEDLSILALESETVAGHTCKVIVLDGRIDPARLRASIASRLPAASELRMRLRDVAGTPCWMSGSALDLDAHVVVHPPTHPLDDAGLRTAVAALFEQRLDRSRPLWRMDVFPELTDDRSALVWRIHHALADGTTSMRLAGAVLWDEESGPPPAVAPPPARSGDHRPAAVVRPLLREAPRPWRQSPFDGQIGAGRSVAFANAELGGLRRAARASGGATINDALLTVVAGGLRRWLEASHGRLGSVRVKVPVSLHGMPGPDDDHRGGNRDSFFCVDLPLAAEDPVARLEAIRRATRTRKDAHDAERVDALMRELGHASPRLRRFAEQALAHPRSFALNVSNVRGPQHPVRLLGVPVRSLHSIAEIRSRHALRIAVMSLADTISFGLCADPTLVPGVERLAEYMQDEAAALAEFVSG